MSRTIIRRLKEIENAVRKETFAKMTFMTGNSIFSIIFNKPEQLTFPIHSDTFLLDRFSKSEPAGIAAHLHVMRINTPERQ